MNKKYLNLAIISMMMVVSNSAASESTTVTSSKQVSLIKTTEYIANFDQPVSKIKAFAKDKLVRETLDELPTYIISTKSIDGNHYKEKIKFIAAAMVRVSNEKYNFSYDDNGQIKTTLVATVNYDTKEILRKVKQIEKDESRGDMLDKFISQNLNIQQQVSDIKSIYQLSVNDGLSKEFNNDQGIKSYVHSLINLPLDDMISNFELVEKQKLAEERLLYIKKLNHEVLSLNKTEQAEFKMNTEIGSIINETYLKQISQPLEPKIIKLTGTKVTIKIAPVTGGDKFLPWYLYDTDKTRELMNKYNSGQPFYFQNSGCFRSTGYHEGSYSILTKGAYPDFEKGYITSSDNITISGIHHQISYDAPILNFTYTTLNKPIVMSLPLGQTWNKPSTKHKSIGKQPIWSIRMTLDGETFVKPFIQNTNYKQLRGSKPTLKPSSVAGTEIQMQLNRAYENESVNKYKMFIPYRINPPLCRPTIEVSYPEFTIERSKVSSISNIKIDVFKS